MTRKRAQRVSEVNQCIRRMVKENPGIHFRGLGRAAHVTSAGQLRHHLDRLERQGVLVEVEDGRYKRFFVAGDQDPKLRPEMARFTRVVPRRIAKLLLVSPMNRSQLRRSLGCADSTLGYHLSRMVTLGDLARERGPNTCIYSLTSGETVRQLLQQQGAAAAAHEGPETLATRGIETPDVAVDPMGLLDSRAAVEGPATGIPGESSDDVGAPGLPDPVPDLIGHDADPGRSGLPF